MTLEQESNTGLLDMKENGLIQSVIEVVGLDNGMVKVKFTPLDHRPLFKDDDGESIGGMFSYSSAFGMLLHLSGHPQTDIAFTVSCCERYVFCPKKYHELVLKRLV